MEAYAYRPQPKTSFVYPGRPPQLFFFDEFITPVSLSVFQITREIPGSTLEEVGPRCYGVVMGMEYVTDWEQFHVEDFFQLPFEMLKNRKGDCEDYSNLLTSLLTGCGLPNATTVYGTVALEDRVYAHSWCEVGRVFIEPTDPEYRPLEERPGFYAPEIAVAWGYSYPVGYAVSWQAMNSEPKRKHPKLTPEELKKLHEALRK